MNYEKVYNQLIEHRRQNPIIDKSIGIERHHIKPKKIYPELKKDKNNIVCLTYKEHFLAHHLLFNMYLQQFGAHDQRTIKMAYAFKRMKFDRKHHYKITMKQYEKVRRIVAKDFGKISKDHWKSMSEHEYRKFVDSHTQHGENNGMYGKGYLLKGSNNGAYNKKWIFNPLTKEQKYVLKDTVNQYIEKGWKMGLLRKSKGTTGTKWINNGAIRKSVLISKLPEYLNSGWKLGFRIK